MNPAEANAVLATLSAAFRTELREETRLMWAQHLAKVDAEAGLEAAGLLAETADRMPSLAEVRRTAAGLVRRERELIRPDTDGPRMRDPVTTKEQGKANIARLRELLKPVGTETVEP